MFLAIPCEVLFRTTNDSAIAADPDKPIGSYAAATPITFEGWPGPSSQHCPPVAGVLGLLLLAHPLDTQTADDTFFFLLRSPPWISTLGSRGAWRQEACLFMFPFPSSIFLVAFDGVVLVMTPATPWLASLYVIVCPWSRSPAALRMQNC